MKKKIAFNPDLLTRRPPDLSIVGSAGRRARPGCRALQAETDGAG